MAIFDRPFPAARRTRFAATRLFVLGLVLAGLVAAVTPRLLDQALPPAAVPVSTKAGAAVSLQTLGQDGAWCWFAETRAVRHRGQHDRTYVGWISRDGDIVVGQYDHRSRLQISTTLVPRFQRNDHANPTLLVRPDGRVQVFWSAHNGPRLYSAISSHPEDITEFGEPFVLDVPIANNLLTYPSVFHLPGDNAGRGRYVMFFRAGYTWPAVTSSVDGIRWTVPRYLLSSGAAQRPYVKVAKSGDDSLQIAYTDGHPHNSPVNNVYTISYRDGAFWSATGTRLAGLDGPTIPAATGDLVYRSPGDGSARAWLHDVAVDLTGKPVVLYTVFPSQHDHRYRYATWTGSAFTSVELAKAGGTISPERGEVWYTAGGALDHADPATVYLSLPDSEVGWRVQRWRTADAGLTWTTRHLTPTASTAQLRPVRVVGQPAGDENVGTLYMAGEYRSFTDYTTSIETTSTAAVIGVSVRQDDASSSVTVQLSSTGLLSDVSGRTVRVQRWDGARFTTTGSSSTDRAGTAVLDLPADSRYRVIVDDRVHAVVAAGAAPPRS